MELYSLPESFINPPNCQKSQNSWGFECPLEILIAVWRVSFLDLPGYYRLGLERERKGCFENGKNGLLLKLKP
jgi:hypothetical protein